MSGFVPHAFTRLCERTDLDVTRNQILRAIESNQIVYAKRLTASRSLAYVVINENVIKIIISKSSKKVISVIPWKSVFRDTLKIKCFDCQYYEVELFPDCFLETDCNHALTKIHKIHTDGAREPIAHNHPDFDKVFKMAWVDFTTTNENHQKIQKERQSGNEKIKTDLYRGESNAA